jgi:hypothetical protein
MKKLFLLSVITSLILGWYGCKKDDDGDDQPLEKHELLLEKTWYNNPNKGRGDHFFGSDGTLQVTNPTWSGTYVWGPNDSMTIIIPGGGTVNWWFRKIEKDYMEYWPTNELPENIYQFTTTKP